MTSNAFLKKGQISCRKGELRSEQCKMRGCLILSLPYVCLLYIVPHPLFHQMCGISSQSLLTKMRIRVKDKKHSWLQPPFESPGSRLEPGSPPNSTPPITPSLFKDRRIASRIGWNLLSYCQELRSRCIDSTTHQTPVQLLPAIARLKRPVSKGMDRSLPSPSSETIMTNRSVAPTTPCSQPKDRYHHQWY